MKDNEIRGTKGFVNHFPSGKNHGFRNVLLVFFAVFMLGLGYSILVDDKAVSKASHVTCHDDQIAGIGAAVPVREQ